MLALIDSDTICYAAAAVSEGQSESIAMWNANSMVEDTLRKLNTNEFRLYLTGENNFRYRVYPEYKANRLKMEKPQFLQVVRQHLVDEWGAQMSDGCEADDELGIDHTYNNENGIESIIVSIDKDLKMIPGWNYNPRKDERTLISPTDAIRFFYYQLLVGDTADNIKGASGIGPKRATAILSGLTTERDLLSAVQQYYSSEEELEQNARCLWIARRSVDEWRIANIDTTISEEQG
jgi:DNA polymerase-1